VSRRRLSKSIPDSALKLGSTSPEGKRTDPDTLETGEWIDSLGAVVDLNHHNALANRISF
jgi:hypothetical protein